MAADCVENSYDAWVGLGAESGADDAVSLAGNAGAYWGD